MDQANHSEAGAAAVELAISSLVLVALVLYTVYAGEISVAALKAQEAEIAAAWDVSAYRLHDLANPTPGNLNALRTTAIDNSTKLSKPNSVRHDLRGFDSFTKRATSGFLVARGAGGTSLSSLTCAADNTYPTTLNVGLAEFQQRGYIRCRATATVTNGLLPESNQEFSITTARLNSTAGASHTQTVAGIADYRTPNTAHEGMALLVDEWALETAATVHRPAAGSGSPYYQAAGDIYKQPMVAGADATTHINSTLYYLPEVGQKDHANSSDFKLAFNSNVNYQEAIERHVGNAKPHVTPLSDVALTSGGNSTLFHALYQTSQRKPNVYLGNLAAK